ncbi:hypothetical protein SAY87_031767 [Trapa incisa]|uniref:4-coumarate--CoA ligase n=1 Tax=Trapa incisa TaxID=236973 RepID=A0AAN7KWL1_9MYRT|nr:hypothetical protein SAY87_031767 [Trapa incisa]
MTRHHWAALSLSLLLLLHLLTLAHGECTCDEESLDRDKTAALSCHMGVILFHTWWNIQIAPADLEAVLISHTDITDVAVAGAAVNEEYGEIPAAFVVGRNGSTVSEEGLIDLVAKQPITDSTAPPLLTTTEAENYSLHHPGHRHDESYSCIRIKEKQQLYGMEKYSKKTLPMAFTLSSRPHGMQCRADPTACSAQ